MLADREWMRWDSWKAVCQVQLAGSTMMHLTYATAVQEKQLAVVTPTQCLCLGAVPQQYVDLSWAHRRTVRDVLACLTQLAAVGAERKVGGRMAQKQWV